MATPAPLSHRVSVYPRLIALPLTSAGKSFHLYALQSTPSAKGSVPPSASKVPDDEGVEDVLKPEEVPDWEPDAEVSKDGSVEDTSLGFAMFDDDGTW